MKESVDVFEYAPHILKRLKKGILLTTMAGNKVNTMVIGWGTIGIEWGVPIFTVFVRENRFSKKLLDQNPEFTINVPLESCDKNIITVAGTKSGRDMDKIAALGLHLEESAHISVPGIRELPLTLECRVIYSQAQNPDNIPAEIKAAYYPDDVDGSHHGANRDYHTAYYGQILAACIIK